MKPVTAFQTMIKPVGPACNLNCTYCYYLEKKKLYPGTGLRMSYDVLENFTRQYIAAQDTPVVTFTWQGGEPTLMGLEFFKTALKLQQKYAGGKKIENVIQTNGTLIDDRWARFFKKHDFLVGVSIDGPREIHDHYRKTRTGGGSFQSVLKGIDRLRRHGVEFNALTVVNDHNVEHPLAVYEFLKTIGTPYFQFIPVVERIARRLTETPLKLVAPSFGVRADLTPWSVDAEKYGRFLVSIFDQWVRHDVGRYFVQLFDVTLANWMGAAPGLCLFSETCGKAVVLEHNGDLYACDHFVYPENFLGNVMQTPLARMMASERQIRFGQNKRDELPRLCCECDYLFACRGECPKNRIDTTADGEAGLNHLCAGLKMFFKHVHPYMAYMAGELKAHRAAANVMGWAKNQAAQPSAAIAREGRLPSPPYRKKKVGRNDPCPCGSGKKYKHCCLNRNRNA